MSETKLGQGEAGLHELVQPLHAIEWHAVDDVQALLKRLCAIFSVSPPEVVFSKRGRSFGRYQFESRRIVLGPQGRELGTFLHEFAHHVVALHAEATGRRVQVHGAAFKSVLRDLCLLAYGIYALPLPPEHRIPTGAKRTRHALPRAAPRPEAGEWVVVDAARYGSFRAVVLRPKRTRAYVKRLSDGGLFDVPFSRMKRVTQDE